MIEIRHVDPDEWAIVREVRLAALQDTPDWFWATYEEEVTKPEGWWRDFIAAGAWFVAYEGVRPVGVAAAVEAPYLGASDRQLISMWVAPEARNRGIGERLVDAVKAWARYEGVRELQLQVTQGNEDAARLYERCGFRATGRTVPLPRAPQLIEREMRFRV